MDLLSQKELCAAGGWLDWRITTKTFRKERRRYGLYPVNRDGLRPMFHPDDVSAAQQRRLRIVLASYGIKFPQPQPTAKAA